MGLCLTLCAGRQHQDWVHSSVMVGRHVREAEYKDEPETWGWSWWDHTEHVLGEFMWAPCSDPGPPPTSLPCPPQTGPPRPPAARMSSSHFFSCSFLLSCLSHPHPFRTTGMAFSCMTEYGKTKSLKGIESRKSGFTYRHSISRDVLHVVRAQNSSVWWINDETSRHSDPWPVKWVWSALGKQNIT